MSDERQLFGGVAKGQLPPDAQPKEEPTRKRLAPRVNRPIRHDSEKQAERYGRVVSIRFPQDFADMLKAAEEKHGIHKRDLVMLAVCPYVLALENEQLEVPIKTDGEIDLPDIPEIT